MSALTGIEWCDHTFNPWWGCTKVSEGCKACYAEVFAKRTGNAVWGDDAARRFFTDRLWGEPRRWNNRCERLGDRALVFCASMADVFEKRDDLIEPRARLFNVITSTPNLVWLLLTKRPENILDMLPPAWGQSVPENVWVGATAENRDRLIERRAHLLGVNGKRFLSCEPLLGRIGKGERLDGIDWVIIGGESGPKPRPMNLAWMEELAANCVEQRVPYFIKQDNGVHPGAKGRISDALWSHKWRPTYMKRMIEKDRPPTPGFSEDAVQRRHAQAALPLPVLE